MINAKRFSNIYTEILSLEEKIDLIDQILIIFSELFLFSIMVYVSNIFKFPRQICNFDWRIKSL